jgi:hypothetical protein
VAHQHAIEPEAVIAAIDADASPLTAHTQSVLSVPSVLLRVLGMFGTKNEARAP